MSECFPEAKPALAEELRESWRNHGQATLIITLQVAGKNKRTEISGYVEYVAPTGAFTMVGGRHVPLDRVIDWETYGYRKRT